MAVPFQFKAKSIIGEGRTTQQAIDSVKEWLELSAIPPLQEEFIVLFLLACLNDIDMTKKTIENYFRVKNKSPQLFNNLNVNSKQIENIFKAVNGCVIPVRMENNVVVVVQKLIDSDYRKFDFPSYIKLACMMWHLCQISNPPNELVIILDLKELSLMHLTCISIKTGVSYLEYLQDAIPIKIKNIHVLNSNFVFERLLSIFKFFIKDGLMPRIHTYSSGVKMEDFNQKWIPAAYLPREYDGDLASFDELCKETTKQLKNMQGFFDAEENLRRSYDG